MTESIHNFAETGVTYTDLIFSPDDGGWYFHEASKEQLLSRTSRRIFPSADDAKKDFNRGLVKWSKWS